MSKLGGLFRLLPPARIRWKIIAPYLVLTFIVAIGGTFLVTRVITNSFQDRLASQLSEAGVVASNAVVKREAEHLETLRTVVHTIGVRESVVSRDKEALRALIEPALVNDSREYVHVLDSNGALILGLTLIDQKDLVYEETEANSGLNDTDMVRHVLAGGDGLGDKSAQLVLAEAGPIFYTAAPLRDGERIVGVAIVGSSLADFLMAIKLDALAEVTFYDLNGDVLGSTIPDGSMSISDSGLADSVEPGVIAGLRKPASLGGRDFDLLYGELKLRDQTVGLFSVALPTSFVTSAINQARTIMTVIFSVAAIGVLLMGVVIAQGVTRPLLALVKSSRAVASGDLTIRSSVRSRDEVGILARSFNQMTDRLADQHLKTIRALTSAIDARDPYTAGHSVRVGQLSVEIGRELDLSSRSLQYLEVGGYLHDIGKIGIRDHVLLKEGPLTKQERQLIEDHPLISLNIVRSVDLAGEVLEVVSGHHEKLDGSGYPYGRTSESISIFARIASVSDIYDALTTERPYKDAFSIQRAVDILRAEVSAGQLDERVVEGLVAVLPRWRHRVRLEKGLQGYSMEELSDTSWFDGSTFKAG